MSEAPLWTLASHDCLRCGSKKVGSGGKWNNIVIHGYMGKKNPARKNPRRIRGLRVLNLVPDSRSNPAFSEPADTN